LKIGFPFFLTRRFPRATEAALYSSWVHPSRCPITRAPSPKSTSNFFCPWARWPPFCVSELGPFPVLHGAFLICAAFGRLDNRRLYFRCEGSVPEISLPSFHISPPPASPFFKRAWLWTAQIRHPQSPLYRRVFVSLALVRLWTTYPQPFRVRQPGTAGGACIQTNRKKPSTRVLRCRTRRRCAPDSLPDFS